jgi:DNA-binding PadR family transcriptional regulator
MPTSPPTGGVASMLPLQPRDYLILFALVDGERHGHAILEAVESQAGGVVFDPANLYRSLRKMRRQGLMEEAAERRVGQHGGRPRRFFGLTELGHAVLSAEAERLAQLADAARAKRLVPKSRGAS